MNLSQLYDYLCGLRTSEGDLKLRPDDGFPEEFNGLMRRIPNGGVVLHAAEVTFDGSLLDISGTCKDTRWNVQGLDVPSLEVSAMHIEASGEGAEMKVAAETDALLTAAGGISFRVSAAYIQKDVERPWKMTAAQAGVSLTPVQAVSLAFNYPVPFPVPESIDFLGSVLTAAGEDYSVLFYPNTTLGASTLLTLRSADIGWNPLPGIFSFRGIDVGGSFKPDTFSLTVTGRMSIGNIPTDVGVCFGASPVWRIFLRPAPPADRFPGLSALAGLVGGKPLEESVSKGFESVQIATGPEFDAAISCVEAYADLSAPRLETFDIGSILKVGALELDVKLELPSIAISGNLHDGKPLGIRALLESLGFSEEAVLLVPENLEVSRAVFAAALRKGSYSLNIGVANIWQAGPFSLDKISLYLGYDTVRKVQGSFGCEFGLTDAVSMILEAEYGIEERGWVFRGGIAAGDSFRMEDLVKVLGDSFGINELPEPVKTLELTELSLSYATATGSFVFSCAGSFTVDDVAISMSVYVGLLHKSGTPPPSDAVQGSGGWYATFNGQLTIDDMVFDIRFDNRNMKADMFAATYHHKDTGSVPLRELVKGVSESLSEYIPEGLVIDLKEVKFIYLKQQQAKQFLFGLQLDVTIDLKDTPVIGEKLPDGTTLGLKDLQVVYASANFTKEQSAVVNPLLPEGILPLPAEGADKGLTITGKLEILSLVIVIDSGKKQPRQTLRTVEFTGSAADGNAVAPSEITWFDVNKQLGPMTFGRIGLAFADNVLSFALDASLALGPASLTMTGLTLGSPLSEFEPVFGLQGFSMEINTASLKIGGAFLRETLEGVDSYYGMVLVRAGAFGLSALGGNTPKHTSPDPDDPSKTVEVPASFFLYANVEIPPGGPPCLSITGFAGGFGINNRLVLPTLDELPGYILLPGPGSKAPKQEATAKDTIAKVLPRMQKYFVQQPGQYWMAAGVSVTSFQMINAFAVLTVSFGVDFQIGIIGSASMKFPKGTASPAAYVEIAVMASYCESSGLLAIEGAISPSSYILGDFCRLSGSFAFYIWLSPPAVTGGPRKGDFLVSVGGYHPAFSAPAYYPKLKRLGINFSLGPLQALGEGYFAATQGMFMAGLHVKSTWNLVVVKAWFELGADFIIGWAPFEYRATAYVTVGCSVNLGIFTVTASIGASLDLWGPPFGGKATIDLCIVKFDIAFGAERGSDHPMLTWKQFREQFLPADAPAKTAAVADAETRTRTGIIRADAVQGLAGTDVDGMDWILQPDGYVLTLSTEIPVTEISMLYPEGVSRALPNDVSEYDSPDPPTEPDSMPYLVTDPGDALYGKDGHVWNPTCNVKPMGANGVTSHFKFAVSRMSASGEYDDNITSLTVCPTVRDSAAALWDKYSGDTKVTDPASLESTLTGVTVKPLPRRPSAVNAVLLQRLLFQQDNLYMFAYMHRAVAPDYDVVSEGESTSRLVITVSAGGKEQAVLKNEDYVLNSLADSWVEQKRQPILENLRQCGFDTACRAKLTNISTVTALTDWPAVRKLGEDIGNENS